MRIGLIILALMAIAMALVKVRRDEVLLRHDTQQLQGRLLVQRRDLWDIDVRLGKLTAVEAVRNRAEDMGVSLVAPHGCEDPRQWPAWVAQQDSQ